MPVVLTTQIELGLVRFAGVRAGCMGIMQVIHRLADLLQVLVHGLTVGVVGLVEKIARLGRLAIACRRRLATSALRFVFFCLR